MPSYPAISWVQADALGIETDPASHAWHAGHVNDVLTVAPSAVLAAADSGGVWRFLPGPDPSVQLATPLSNDWENPDMTCLALGPDAHQHVFAGCASLSTASHDGSTVHVGGFLAPASIGQNAQAAVFRVDSVTQTPVRLPDPPPLVAGIPDTNTNVTRLLFLADGTLMAVYRAAAGGCVLRLGAKGWTQESPDAQHPSTYIFALAVDDQQTLYATTDSGVFQQHAGQAWEAASAGLPRRTHGADIRYIRNQHGGIGLYLATFGRSVWRATWTARDPGPKPGRAPAFAWNDLIGSLADGNLYKLGIHGLVPVGPIDPLLDKQVREAYAGLVSEVRTIVAIAGSPDSTGKASSAAVLAAAGADQALTALVRGAAILETLANDPAPDRDATWLAAQLAKGSDLVARASGALGPAAQAMGDKRLQASVGTLAATLSVLNKLTAQVSAR